MAIEVITPTIETITPSRYTTGQYLPGDEVCTRVTYGRDVPFGNGVSLWDRNHPEADFRGHVGKGYGNRNWGIQSHGQRVYDICYNVPNARSSVGIFIPILVYDTETGYFTNYNPYEHGDHSSGYTGFSFSYGAPPSDIELTPEAAFISNGQTITISFQMILKAFITINHLEVSAGSLSNFRGNNNTYQYAVDLTAPDTGVGIIELSVRGYDGIFETFLHAPPPSDDMVFLEMKNTPPHLARFDDEVIYTREVTEDDPDDINDFNVMSLFDANTTGFTQDDLQLHAIDTNNNLQEASIQDFEGENAVYKATIRPPSTGGEGKIVISLKKDAVAGWQSTEKPHCLLFR